MKAVVQSTTASLTFLRQKLTLRLTIRLVDAECNRAVVGVAIGVEFVA